MESWKQLGRWISEHMVFIVPLCIVVGVLVPDLLIPLRPAIPTLFAIVTFQNALGNNLQSLRDTMRHPAPFLVTGVLVMIVAPILVRLIGGALFGGDPDILAGLVLEACVPVGATTVMWSSVYGGNVALALAVMLVTTTLAPFSIPATLSLLVGTSVQVDALGMIADMLYMVGVPALLGVMVNELSHGWGKERLSPAMAPLSSVLVPIIIATNATGISEFMLNLTPKLTFVAIFVGCLTLVSTQVGLLVARLMRQPRDVQVTMTFDCGIRNISAGAVLASAYLPPGSLFPVMIGTLFQQFIAAIMGHVLRRQAEEASPEEDA